MSVKNSSDIIGNRTRDLLAFSAVPQPNAPLRAPKYKSAREILEVLTAVLVKIQFFWDVPPCRLVNTNASEEPYLPSLYLLQTVTAPYRVPTGLNAQREFCHFP
jgi:hypothetical protein